MLFPYSTDAPIYHFPYCTIGLIVVNTLMYLATIAGVTTPDEFDSVKWLCLEYDTINPLQWLTNNFMHGGIEHLLSNMVFLWSFGLVVEGKLGWQRFLATYLGIGLVAGALEQVFMFLFFSSPSCSLGASGVIFGLMGIAFIWAPKNDMNCFLWLGFFSRIIELPIMGICGFYFALQILFFWLGGFQMSSEALHLVGLAIGLPVGIVMLKRGMVDCEGWDLFNVLRGNETNAAREALEKRMQKAAADEHAEKAASIDQQRQEALTLLRRAIEEQQHAIVAALYRKHVVVFDYGNGLGSREFAGVVQAMHQQKQWAESIPLMRSGMQRFPGMATSLRLNLAQLLIQHIDRPRQALALLQQLPAELPEAQAARRRQLLAHAQRQIQEGSLEMDVEQW